MLEIQSNDVVFLYKKEKLTGTEVKWNIVRRLLYFSNSLCQYSNFNYLFSPNLLMYLDFSSKQNKYYIKSSVTQEELITINEGYLNPKTDNPEHLVKRFKWISNTSFKIINFEGFEKIFDITEVLRDKKKPLKIV